MKKLLTISALAFSLFTFQSKAQLASGSLAKDFTFTDLSGTTHNLYTYLNQGKTVFIDISASWCNPCWQFHATGYWDDLYVNHGPSGFPNVSATTTNDVMVLFIEGDSQTTDGCLYNNSSCNTSYAPSQGDWVTGTKYPIISNNTAACDSFDNNYQIAYFPTLYMICPDRMVTEVSSSLTSGAAYYALIASTPCTVASSALDASLQIGNGQNLLSVCDSINPTVYLTNESTTPLTSATITYKVNGTVAKTYNWTGNLSTYNNAAITGIKLAGPVGSNTITATVSNPNGGTDAVAANNTNGYTIASAVMSPATTTTVTEGFQGGTFPPANWGNINGGDQSYMWTTANVGGKQASTKSVYIDLWDTPTNDVDELVLQPIDMSSYTTASMSFDIAKAGITNQTDQLKVKASTDCGQTWTTVYFKYDFATSNPLQTVTSNTAWTPSSASQWRTDVINLNTLAGNASVILKFQTISGYSNNLYIDNINLTASNGIKEINNITNVGLYPNPASANTTVEIGLTEQENVSINIYNTMGQSVMSQQHNQLSAGDHSFALNTENLAGGIYNVVVKTGKGFNTQKLVISK